MMFRFTLARPDVADRIEAAVRAVLKAGKRTGDIALAGRVRHRHPRDGRRRRCCIATHRLNRATIQSYARNCRHVHGIRPAARRARISARARSRRKSARPKSRRSRRPDRSPRPAVASASGPGAGRIAAAADFRVNAMRVGFVGWRGMVGSVLLQRMQAERDFDHIESQFFSTSNVGGKGPSIGKSTPALLARERPRGAQVAGRGRHLPGRRLHQRRLSEAARRRLERLLDRRRIGAAHGRRRRDHPRSRQPRRDRRGACARCEDLRRRQLHRQPDADGAARASSGTTWSSG